MFESIKSRIVVRGTLTLQSGLHVGRQPSADPVGSDLPVVRDRHRRPFVPGSSLKGVLRQTAERLIRGIGAPACEPFPNGSCLRDIPKERRMLRDSGLPDEEIDQKIDERITQGICTTCSVFGSTERGAKLSVRDALWVGEGVARVEVRDGVGIDRDTGTAAPGVKYDFEVVPVGSRFGLELVLENAEPWEAGLVFVGLAEIHSGHAMLGGMTSRGLGRVAVGFNSIEEWDARSILAGSPLHVYGGTPLPAGAVAADPSRMDPEIG